MAKAAVQRSLFQPLRSASFLDPSSVRTDLSAFVLLGVGHEVKSLPDMRCPEARSAGINHPEGVFLCFQVSLNSAEPSKAVFTRNLLSKELRRKELRNEVVERRP